MSDQDEAADVSLHGLPVASDAEHFRARVPLEILVTRFTDAVRRGERPSIDDYALRFADWADQIRELFPLIESLERWKIDKEVECLRRNMPEEFPMRRLGEYQLVRELGRGGMGIVFEAVQETSGRRFAVKLLPWRYAADMAQWRESFQREAATIAKLRHPNIVRVYSFGTDEGYCYYSMQLVEGVGLDSIIGRLRESNDVVYVDEIRRAGRSDDSIIPPTRDARPSQPPSGLHRDSWVEFALIGKQVALALGHAHASGVTHNDVKPANLLLEQSGRVIVTDFGIGHRRDDDLPGEDDHAVGTLRFMAPERILGVGDTRSDVYSLGATLYELCTQRPAFEADDRGQLVERILQSQLVPPRTIVPRMPRRLETIILNAMAREPGDRYPFAEAMAADLLRFINGQPIRSTRPGPVRQAWRWFRQATAAGGQRPR